MNMLRSLGSSLVAKSSPGGRLREIGERAITTPQIPGKGAIGSISRAGLEEPLKREVPAGSEKVVGMQPIVESQAGLPADILPSEVGMPMPIPEGATPSVASSVPSGSRGQALFQGGVGGQPNAGGATAGASRQATKQVSQGVPFVGYKPPQVETQGGETQQTNPNIRPLLPQTGINQMAGGKVFAGEGGIPRTAAQKVVGGLGKTVSSVPIQAVKNVGNMMQSWGGQTIKSAPQARNVPRPSFIQGVKNQLRSVVQNFFSRLRSRGGRSW